MSNELVDVFDQYHYCDKWENLKVNYNLSFTNKFFFFSKIIHFLSFLLQKIIYLNKNKKKTCIKSLCQIGGGGQSIFLTYPSIISIHYVNSFTLSSKSFHLSKRVHLGCYIFYHIFGNYFLGVVRNKP